MAGDAHEMSMIDIERLMSTTEEVRRARADVSDALATSIPALRERLTAIRQLSTLQTQSSAAASALRSATPTVNGLIDEAESSNDAIQLALRSQESGQLSLDDTINVVRDALANTQDLLSRARLSLQEAMTVTERLDRVSMLLSSEDRRLSTIETAAAHLAQATTVPIVEETTPTSASHAWLLASAADQHEPQDRTADTMTRSEESQRMENRRAQIMREMSALRSASRVLGEASTSAYSSASVSPSPETSRLLPASQDLLSASPQPVQTSFERLALPELWQAQETSEQQEPPHTPTLPRRRPLVAPTRRYAISESTPPETRQNSSRRLLDLLERDRELGELTRLSLSSLSGEYQPIGSSAGLTRRHATRSRRSYVDVLREPPLSERESMDIDPDASDLDAPCHRYASLTLVDPDGARIGRALSRSDSAGTDHLSQDPFYNTYDDHVGKVNAQRVAVAKGPSHAFTSAHAALAADAKHRSILAEHVRLPTRTMSNDGVPSLAGIPLKYISLVTLTVQNSTLAILIHYSRTAPGARPYSTAAAVLLGEILKGVISLAVALANTYTHLDAAPYGSGSAAGHYASPGAPLKRRISNQIQTIESSSMRYLKLLPSKSAGLFKDVFSDDCWKLSIPALLYYIQNNLQFVAASNLDVATFQVTYQLKILTTALFSVVLLRRRLSLSKWLSLVGLGVGVAIVQLQTAPASSHHDDSMNPLKGFIAVSLSCLTSGLAGVYFEMVLKGSKADLWVRNTQLSFFSLLPALLPVVAPSFTLSSLFDGTAAPALSATAKPVVAGLFDNFGFWAIATVLVQVAGGLITALVIKHADNILKGFATSLSIIISFIAGVMLFDAPVTTSFVVGCGIVLCATYMYNAPSPGSSSSGYAPVGAAQRREKSSPDQSVHSSSEKFQGHQTLDIAPGHHGHLFSPQPQVRRTGLSKILTNGINQNGGIDSPLARQSQNSSLILENLNPVQPERPLHPVRRRSLSQNLNQSRGGSPMRDAHSPGPGSPKPSSGRFSWLSKDSTQGSSSRKSSFGDTGSGYNGLTMPHNDLAQ
ncbi:uncharacterized protein L969DRAFT_96108 [Mixia osmundae IAM 14324]|uniref:Nucleotide-sugar transporter n=1 Tax=Mixia osmundae (strain CBS 9802 / IAM 14324 / JCM 22182 / KY 12970) TaxID=764103 RepID=G7DT10_MIXOS|nr:uncharacterized protein L969DRAFT_96108 [Mixia osmundae IAM 14324]KEI37578.1 hypothetical protein L969DRAFT_96108 [Mixia osmundae IAM 14324]GAA93720.1 hypothetical protein E5Q_00366 [Mixia osmundae IAM 14324]